MRLSIVRWSALVGLTVLLSGCVGVSLVGRYDPAIEESINSYHVKAIAFISRAEATAGTPAGLYSSKESVSFYAEQGAALDNLLIRADISDEGRPCGTAKIAALVSAPTIPAGQTLRPNASEAGCTVIVIQGLQVAHNALQHLHQKLAYLRAPVSTDLKSAIDDAVRVALANEAQKK